MMRFQSAALLFTFVALTACGSSGTSRSTVTCDQKFWNGMFAACLPKGWKVLSQGTLKQVGVPEETVAAFQYDTPHAGQMDTVTAVREPLSQDMTTTEYSNSNILAVSALPDYKMIDKTVVTIDGKESAVHVFSARPAPEQPIRRYYQLSAAVDRTGYALTGSFPLSIQNAEADQVEFILRNISFVDPTVAAAK